MGKRTILMLLVSAAGCSDPAMVEVLTFGTGPNARVFGEMCIPMDESWTDFSGYSRGEVSVWEFDPQCATGVCLINDFQGRVSCPRGNLGADECYTPEGELVSVDVRPNMLDISAEDYVYCSCRCGGPSELAPFCECPRGTTCEPLVPHTSVLPERTISGSGSYCVKQIESPVKRDPAFPPAQ